MRAAMRVSGETDARTYRPQANGKVERFWPPFKSKQTSTNI